MGVSWHPQSPSSPPIDILEKEHFILGTDSTKVTVPQSLGVLGTAGQSGNSRVREEERSRGEGVLAGLREQIAYAPVTFI